MTMDAGLVFPRESIRLMELQERTHHLNANNPHIPTSKYTYQHVSGDARGLIKAKIPGSCVPLRLKICLGVNLSQRSPQLWLLDMYACSFKKQGTLLKIFRQNWEYTISMIT